MNMVIESISKIERFVEERERDGWERGGRGGRDGDKCGRR